MLLSHAAPLVHVAQIRAVEAVLGQLPPDSVLERPSSGGAYLSVKLGPVMVESPDQARRKITAEL